MPGFDRTGPWGAGPMTGGGRGFCAPAASPCGRRGGRLGGYGRGRGFGRGYGLGFGRGRAFYPAWGAGPGATYAQAYPMDPAEELEMLKSESEAVKHDLETINRRINELEQKAAK